MKAKVAIALHAIPEFPTLASAIPFHQRSDNDQWNTIARTLTEQKIKNNILARNKPRLLLLPSAWRQATVSNVKAKATFRHPNSRPEAN